MTKEKYALLDADFISKTHLIRKDDQTTFKVHDTSKQMRMCKVPCEQVVEEMYSGKLELLQNGNLRYKQ